MQAPPPRIGRYVIERPLGAGGMGAVHAAYDPQIGRRVAIKVLLDASDPAAASRFAAEAEAAAHLQHPAIVRVHAAGVDAGRPFIVMDLIEGESAQARLERAGPFAPQEAVAVVRAIGAAVAFAHERGVVHRDIKPHNILLGPAGPVLTDFGLARDRRRATLTRTGEAVGTPAYMAPEQFEDLKRAGPSADVYGLGATLYALLAGRAPFEGATPVNIIARVLREPPPPLAVDRDLETICRTCLEKEPGDRYPDVRALLDDLDRWRAGAPIAARRPDAAERAWRWVRRWRRHALALVAAAALAAAGLTLRAALPSWRALPSREDVRRLAGAGDLEAAIAALGELLAAEPGASDLWAWRGRLRAGTGDLQGGLDDLDRALTLAPDDVDALTARAEVLGRGGDRDALERDLVRLHALRPGNAAVRRDLVALRLERADEAYARGDLDLTVAACTSALAVEQHHPRALALRAVARWEASGLEPDDDQAVLEDLQEALRLDPRLAWAHAAVARLQLWMNDPEPARAAAERAHELEPTPRHAVLRLAVEVNLVTQEATTFQYLKRLGAPPTESDLAKHARTVERIAADLDRLSSSNAESLSVLANLLAYTGRFAEGLAVVERALASAPNDPLLHASRARLLAFLDDPNRAAEAVAEAILAGDRPEHRARRRWLLRRLDRDVVGPFVLHDETPAPDARFLAAMKRAPLRLAAGDVSGWLQDIEVLRARIAEGSLRGRETLVELLERTGPTADGRWARALFLAAAYRLRQGARDQARAAARRALELAPGLAGWDHELVRLADEP